MSLNKSVLITGAGGFIGLHAVKVFLNAGFEVHAMVHKRIPQELIGMDEVKIIIADIRSRKSVASALANFQPDILVHIAGITVDTVSDREAREVNFEPVKYLVNIPKEKIIYFSSTDVYGIKDFSGENEDELPLDLSAKNPYPKYKIKSELWLNDNLNKSKFVILRPAAVYGENDRTLELRVVNFLKYSPFIVHFGKWKGKNRWPVVNVKTVCEAAVQCALTRKFDGEAINVIDENVISIDDYYNEVASKHYPGRTFKTISLPLWIGKILGYISTSLTLLLGLRHPIFDPTAYSLLHISSNLDFDCEKLKRLLSDKIC